MSEDTQEFELPEPPEQPDPAEFERLKAELVERCNAAKIPIREEASPDPDDFLASFLVLSMPCGREKREVYLFDTDDLSRLLGIEFERYSFLGDYSAICRPDKLTIEAGVRSIGTPVRGRGFYRLIEERVREGEVTKTTIKSLTLEGVREGLDLKLTFGPPSQEFSILVGVRLPRMFSLTIQGIPSIYHDAAVAFLERLSDSLFFQIDSLFETPLGLMRRRTPLRRRRRGSTEVAELALPDAEYDQAPMSLYFYGRSAVGLPLVQFLAFYQVIEFYFPVCYQAEARRRIRSIIKDPAFRTDRDSDISKIVSSLQVGSSPGYADERAMLRAAIQECIDPADLRAFLEEDEAAAEFYKAKVKGLTDHKLPIENKQIDLRGDVAERIYDIRCKIVHTKISGRDGSYELLLPYSKEATLLHYDIDLVHYVARKALVYASSSFRFNA